MQQAIISCDLDTVDRHLQGYGIDDLDPCDRIYRTAIPRFLELLDELSIPAVFFVIARDAPAQRELLRRIADAGHEIASHSLTHPQPFRTLGDDDLRREVYGSRELLQEVVGREVVGFRTPAWDVDERVLDAVADAGYAYDASSFPTPALIASRYAVSSRSEGRFDAFRLATLRRALGRTKPHSLPKHGGSAERPLVEFPVAVTPLLRIPVYHTMSYFLPPWLFERSLASALRAPGIVSYELHAADLLDLKEDQVDDRMGRHPGMDRPVAAKRAALERVLRTIRDAREVTTYATTVESLHEEAARGRAA